MTQPRRDPGASGPPDPGPRLTERFLAACARGGDALALDDGTHATTYRDLAGAARSVAATVRGRTGPEEVVAVVATKTGWAVAAMFGVALAGRAALLLDPDDPDAWWCERTAHTGARLVLADDPVPHERTVATGRPRLGPADCPPVPETAGSAEGPPVDGGTGTGAWILCTSGSTGRPKYVWNDDGVLGDAWHRLAARVAAWGVAAPQVLVLPPLTFAAARIPLFQALDSGACARLIDTPRCPPGEILDLLAEGRSRSCYVDPALLRVLVTVADARQVTVPTLVRLEVAGAAVVARDVLAARRAFPAASLTVHYGSTELGTVSTLTLAPDDDPTAPGALAAPLVAGVRARITDEAGLEVVPGTVGDLWIAAERPMAERRDDPEELAGVLHVDRDGTVWHRSGDRARILADGRLELHGREDDRVKVNGIAVDLNVVAAAVRSLPGIVDAEVTPVGDDDDRRLVAWTVVEDGASPTVRRLRAGLADRLPRAQQPHLFRTVGEIPRTARGKVDRMALRAAAAREVSLGVPHVAPSTPTERDLARRVREALDVEDPGLHASFFELGGDSVDALELLTALADDYGLTEEREADVEHALLTVGTIGALAAELDRTVDPAPRAGRRSRTRRGPGRRATGAWNPLTRLQEHGPPTSHPVVLVTGGGQTRLGMRPLLARLPGCTVWTLVAPGFRDGERRARTIRELAVMHADAVLAARPAGDVVLAGYSFGGLVAHEVTRELAARGARTELLALLDAECPTWLLKPPTARVRAARRWRRLTGRPWPGNGSPAGLDDLVGVRPEDDPGDLRRATLRWAASLIPTFRPDPVDVPTLVVRSGQSAARGRPEDLGWSRLCTGSLRSFDVPGSHLDVLHEPAVERIGEALVAAAVTS